MEEVLSDVETIIKDLGDFSISSAAKEIPTTVDAMEAAVSACVNVSQAEACVSDIESIIGQLESLATDVAGGSYFSAGEALIEMIPDLTKIVSSCGSSVNLSLTAPIRHKKAAQDQEA